jgi:hypothetical protein
MYPPPRFSCVTLRNFPRPLRDYVDPAGQRQHRKKATLALYLLPSNKSLVNRRDLAFLSLQTRSVPSQNEMDTGGGDHCAAAAGVFRRRCLRLVHKGNEPVFPSLFPLCHVNGNKYICLIAAQACGRDGTLTRD